MLETKLSFVIHLGHKNYADRTNSVRNLGYINIQRQEENGHKEAIIIQ